jgi:predicted nucleic acid-binding protein
MVFPAPPAQGEFPLTCEPALVVLDTNVVLDWLVFLEPSVADLVDAVLSGRLCWIATSAMRAEFESVLRRGLACARGVEPAAAMAVWDRHARLAPPAPPAHGLRCADPDDQKFIDLACFAGARWLVSRDRAVLRLRRRAAALGLSIRQPGER